ncbi:MAG: FHA domain-containing protein [Polyangiaceae bacterium]|nr:FHA domain-containing protein [Polyangiaceae bacterium]
MISGFGKQTVVIGSGPQCDIVLQGPGVAPEHARIVHQGGGRLIFTDNGQGPTTVNGQPMTPGSQGAFDFRTTYACGGATVPLNHPSIALMLMGRGQVAAPPGHLIIGRDAGRASLVVHHPSVSSQHATVMLDRMSVIDHQSTSGTYTGPHRIQPGTPTPLDPNGIIAFGPVPVPVSLLMQVAQAFAASPQVPGGAGPGLQGAAGPSMHGAGPPMAGGAGPSMHGGPPMQGGPMQGGPMQGGPPMQQGGPPGTRAAMPSGPGGAKPPGGKKHQTVIGSFEGAGQGGKEFKSIGRTPDNDIRLDHPQVSSRHAVLVRQGGQFFIEDRRSANGTYVRGQRIAPGVPTPVASGEKIFIGPMPLVIQVEDGGGQVVVEDYQANWAGKPLYEIEAWRLAVQVPDRDDPGQMKTLLDDVSFKALPGDMIALMGPSGAGKTTLLLTLNGYMPPTSGVVRINGEDLYAIYDALRGSIGYVPQDDLVHPELTVFEAVRYSAKFRLPPDYSEDEIDRRVMATLQQLGLEQVANLQIGRPEKKVLSGGQRKRVNIALELVTDPVILFLDEPTSGLAADDTTALISLLSDLAKGTGKTIIMTIHQPAKDEYEKFNLALVLGYGGVPMFFGPTTPDSYRFFGSFLQRQGRTGDIDNPRDMFDVLRAREQPIFDQMRAQNPNVPRSAARNVAAKEWWAEFLQSQTYQKMYSGPRAIGQQAGGRPVIERAANRAGQLGLLFSRYFKTKTRDVSGTAIMLLQAPIIGALLAVVFGSQREAVPFWCLGALQELSKRGGRKGNFDEILATMTPTSDHSSAAFFLVVSAVWFGTSNAAREIVSERAIYLRERMVNLGLFNYVLSKFLLLALFCVLQCTVLIGIVFPVLHFHGGASAFFIELANLIAVSWCSVSLGLLLSTAVTSSEAAMALTPIALIPQVVLGGLLVPMTNQNWLKVVMSLIPARWGFQGVVAQERDAIARDPSWIIDLRDPTLNSPEDFVSGGRFSCATAQLASETLTGAWGFSNYDKAVITFAVLGGTSLLVFLLVLLLLKRRDPV